MDDIELCLNIVSNPSDSIPVVKHKNKGGRRKKKTSAKKVKNESITTHEKIAHIPNLPLKKKKKRKGLLLTRYDPSKPQETTNIRSEQVDKQEISPPLKKQRISRELPYNNEYSIYSNETMEEEKEDNRDDEPLVYSRKNPVGVENLSQADHHIKPSTLSENALPEPETSKSSDTIFSPSTFSSLGVEEGLVRRLEESLDDGGMGLERSTKIQSVTIPHLLSHSSQTEEPTTSTYYGHHKIPNHCFIKAQTGSGKVLI